MNNTKREKLVEAGWRVADSVEFLGLSDAEKALLDIRETLGRCVKGRRAETSLTQAQLAVRMGSSQSRVARIEAGDPTVSLELMIRAMLALGADRNAIAAGISGGVA